MNNLEAAYQLKASSSFTHNLWVFSAHCVVGCGDNSRGQLRDDFHDASFDAPVPMPLGRSVTILGVSCGDLHVVAWARDGRCYGQGSDALGQLGHIKTPAQRGKEFARMSVPFQELTFFGGKERLVRQAWCTSRGTIWALANEQVFVSGENAGGNLLCSADRIEFHVPTRVGGFGVERNQVRLRGVEYSAEFMLWLGADGALFASTPDTSLYRLQFLKNVRVSSASLGEVRVAHKLRPVIFGMRDGGDAFFCDDYDPSDPEMEGTLKPLPTIERVVGIVAVGSRALVWSTSSMHVVTLKAEGGMEWQEWTRENVNTQLIEVCINFAGIGSIDEERAVRFHPFKTQLQSEVINAPITSTRPSLGGNFCSILMWRKELHHLAGVVMRRIVFFLLCCRHFQVEPFGLLPRDVIYYILSFLPLA